MVLRAGEAALEIRSTVDPRAVDRHIARIATLAREVGLEVSGPDIENAFWQARNYLARRLGEHEVHPW